MEKFIKGDVIVVSFPFSDLSQSKKRPALVVAHPKGNDLILCQITSQQVYDRYAVSLETTDFEQGSLNRRSNVRPNRIFTADENIVLYKIGHLKSFKLSQITDEIVHILNE